MPDSALVIEAGAKALLYVSVLIAIGASVVRWLLLPSVGAHPSAVPIIDIERSVARIALAAASLTFVASGLRVWIQTAAAFGFAGANSWQALQVVAFQSRWGHAWKFQMIASAFLLVASTLTLKSRAFWPLSTVAVLAFTGTLPLLGHAAGEPGRMLLHAVHILAGSAWLGTLLVILLMRLPQMSPRSVEPPLTRRQVRLLLLRQFSPIALSSAAIVTAAGVVAAYLYVGTVSNLWTSVYGRILLLKIVLVGGISICGYMNWRRLRASHKDQTSQSIIVLEGILAAALVIVTGFLTETGHPN